MANNAEHLRYKIGEIFGVGDLQRMVANVR